MHKIYAKRLLRTSSVSNLMRYVRPASAATVIMIASGAAAADLDRSVAAVPAISPQLYDWSGFYLGGHLGYQWGKTNFTVANTANPGVPIDGGSQSIAQRIDSYTESGSWLVGAQAGFNHMFANRVIVGGVADFSASAFPNYNNLNTGGVSTILGGTETYNENIFDSGTFRGKVGYAPGNWMVYATGGLAWAYNQRNINDSNTGAALTSYRARLGYAIGGGVEMPFIPHWTAFLEFMYNNYAKSSVTYPTEGQKFNSNISSEQVKFGLNYQFSDKGDTKVDRSIILPSLINDDRINIHLDFSGIYQGYPSFQSPSFNGSKVFRSNGEAREVVSLDLLIGTRLWSGAEFWFNPEIDQGFGVSDTTGLAGFLNNGAFKLGQAAPYARVQNYFIRQTFNFGGIYSDLPAGELNFAEQQSDHRLVITAGRFADWTTIATSSFFDPRGGLSNWNFGFPLTYDFGTDFFGTDYGALGEYYFGRYAVRLGIFEMTKEPFDSQLLAGIAPNPDFFNDFNVTAEVEENHTLFGQPGRIKLTGFIVHGYMADINTAISNAAATGTTPLFDNSRAIANKPGFLVTLEQHVTKDIGLFALVGGQSGRFEPYDGDDSNEYVAAGIQIAGTKWGRPNDIFSVAGAINNISPEYIKFLSEGGTGLEIANGSLPRYGREQVFETYYKYQIFDTTSLTFDYQLMQNPAYEAVRGPINAFLGRVRYYY